MLRNRLIQWCCVWCDLHIGVIGHTAAFDMVFAHVKKQTPWDIIHAPHDCSAPLRCRWLLSRPATVTCYQHAPMIMAPLPCTHSQESNYAISSSSSSLARSRRGPLRHSTMTASDSVSPHFGWGALAVVTDLVQPSFRRTTGTTLPRTIPGSTKRQVNLAT